MGSAKKAPPPPDTSKYSDAAYAQGQQSSEWAKTMWDMGQQEWGRLQQWGQDIIGKAFPAMEDMYDWARQQKDNYEQYAIPAMQSLFSEAELYASKEEESRQRASAVQDVKSATEAQRQANLRKLESYGVDPSEGRYQALDKQAGVAEAAMSALAANQAGERTKQIGRDLREKAIGVGQTMAQNYLNASQLAGNTGTAAIGAATGANVAGSQMAQGALPYIQGAYGGYDLGAGIVDTSYGRTLDQIEQNNAASQQNFNQMMEVGKGIGGMIPGLPKAAEGGPISAPGGPTADRGAITISDGEYVIPADVVRKLGTNHFDKMIEKETGRPPPATKQAVPVDPNASPPQAAGMAPQGYASQAGVLR